MTEPDIEQVGVVVIGRNEGTRLEHALVSIEPYRSRSVYVDSASTDGSVELAKRNGYRCLVLDTAEPLSAARARNAGWKFLLQEHPGLRYIQFVDGDCSVDPEWIDNAVEFLAATPNAAVACGRRREKFSQNSIYNELCDIEWDTPVGETTTCGGDALIRVEALVQVGGYNPRVIAAEDDDLCLRMRRHGWQVFRLPLEMTSHDAAITSWKQWRRRAERAGYAYALGAWNHWGGGESHFVGDVRRILIWALIIPTAIFVTALTVGTWTLWFAAVYPAQALRIALRTRRRVGRLDTSLAYGAACVADKFSQLRGVLRFARDTVAGCYARIIEYK